MAPEYLAKHPCGANILLSQLLIVSFLTSLECGNAKSAGDPLKIHIDCDIVSEQGRESACVCFPAGCIASTVLEVTEGEYADY